MSGEPAVVKSIAALAERGYESVQLTFNADSDWLSLTWLKVLEGESCAPIGDIAKTVHDVDPGAVRI